jgi:chemotaxis protein MotB
MARLRSKSKSEAPEGNFDFLFLQLMLVMMAFFILLNSMAVIVKQKRTKAIDSVSGAFSLLSTGNRPKGQGGSAGKTAIHAANDLTDVTKLLDMHGAVATVSPDKAHVLIRLPEQLLFPSGKTGVDAAMNPFLDILADLLRRDMVKSASINGYTDNSPVMKGFKSNWELSAARAMQVFFALAKRGVPKERMVLAGMGSAHPLPASETHGDPAMNRRVEIRITFKPVMDQDTTEPKGKSPMPALPKVAPGHSS